MSPRASIFLVAEHGEVLSTREEAQSMVLAISGLLRTGEVLMVSFSGVQVASLSFLDELLVALQEVLRKRPECMLVAHGVNSTIRDHIVHIVANRGVLLAVVSRSGVSLLGGDRRSRRLLRVARQLEPEFTASQLMERLPSHAADVEITLSILVESGYLCRTRSRDQRVRTEKLVQPPGAGRLSELAD